MSELARPPVVSRIGWRRGDPPEALVQREWLVTNGLGGYASGTLAGVLTRRYHGLLVAALPVPQGRMVMLSRVDDAVVGEDGTVCPLSVSHASADAPQPPAPSPLESFRLDQGTPVWTFILHDQVLERRVVMPYGQNTTQIIYHRVGGTGALRLRLSLAMHGRRLEDPVSTPIAEPYVLRSTEDRHEIRIGTGARALRVSLFGGATAVSDGAHTEPQFYALEAARGYDSEGELWSPGAFEVEFDSAGMAALVASTEPWEVARSLTPAAALAAETQRRNGLLTMASRDAEHEPAAELTLAADQFLITPAGRIEEAARARAEGDELRTAIAGYHWFTDWGRDTRSASKVSPWPREGRARQPGSCARSRVMCAAGSSPTSSRRAVRTGCTTRPTPPSGTSTHCTATWPPRATGAPWRPSSRCSTTSSPGTCAAPISTSESIPPTAFFDRDRRGTS